MHMYNLRGQRLELAHTYSTTIANPPDFICHLMWSLLEFDHQHQHAPCYRTDELADDYLPRLTAKHNPISLY